MYEKRKIYDELCAGIEVVYIYWRHNHKADRLAEHGSLDVVQVVMKGFGTGHYLYHWVNQDKYCDLNILRKTFTLNIN